MIKINNWTQGLTASAFFLTFFSPIINFFYFLLTPSWFFIKFYLFFPSSLNQELPVGTAIDPRGRKPREAVNKMCFCLLATKKPWNKPWIIIIITTIIRAKLIKSYVLGILFFFRVWATQGIWTLSCSDVGYWTYTEATLVAYLEVNSAFIYDWCIYTLLAISSLACQVRVS